MRNHFLRAALASTGAGGGIVTTNLIRNLDAGDSASYPGSGTTWTDLSSSSIDATLFGPIYNSGNSGSLDFDGSNDYVTTGNLAQPNNNWTYEFWVNVDSLASNRTIISNQTVSSGGSVQIRFTTAGAVQIVKSYISNVGTFTGFTASTGSWYNVAVTKSSTTYGLYVDGSFISSFTSSTPFSFYPGTIGINTYNTEPWDGKIAVVHAYDSALSASDILQNYNALSARYHGLILNLDAGNSASYPGTGTTWTDLSGQGNNGTLINGVGYSSANSGSLVFDGSNDYVSETAGLSDSFLQGNWTISFWANWDVLSTANNGSDDRPLLQHGSAVSNRGLHLTQRNSRIHFGLYGNDLQGTQTLSTGTWYHIAYTLNNATYAKQIYIDGSLDNSHTGSGSYIGTGTNTRIGGKVLPFGNYFDGKISNVTAYPKVLTASEILQEYNALAGRY